MSALRWLLYIEIYFAARQVAVVERPPQQQLPQTPPLHSPKPATPMKLEDLHRVRLRDLSARFADISGDGDGGDSAAPGRFLFCAQAWPAAKVARTAVQLSAQLASWMGRPGAGTNILLLTPAGKPIVNMHTTDTSTQ